MDWYKDYETYPNGPADMIGYWAENFIIGGVLLFDRREPGSAIDDLAPDVDVSRSVQFAHCGQLG